MYTLLHEYICAVLFLCPYMYAHMRACLCAFDYAELPYASEYTCVRMSASVHVFMHTGMYACTYFCMHAWVRL